MVWIENLTKFCRQRSSWQGDRQEASNEIRLSFAPLSIALFGPSSPSETRQPRQFTAAGVRPHTSYIHSCSVVFLIGRDHDTWMPCRKDECSDSVSWSLPGHVHLWRCLMINAYFVLRALERPLAEYRGCMSVVVERRLGLTPYTNPPSELLWYLGRYLGAGAGAARAVPVAQNTKAAALIASLYHHRIHLRFAAVLHFTYSSTSDP